MKKETIKIDSNTVEFCCPSCGTENSFTYGSSLPFLYCSACKYVYAWISAPNEMTVERKDT